MDNDTYREIVKGLSVLLGAAQPLESGNGARFTSAKKGKATAYHSDLAPGNGAEVAFHVDSMAQRLGIASAEFRSIVDQWRQKTGRHVQINQQYQWPRVGFSSIDQVAEVLTLLNGRIAQR